MGKRERRSRELDRRLPQPGRRGQSAPNWVATEEEMQRGGADWTPGAG